MIGFGVHTRVYPALGATDMRKQIDGLAVRVEDVLVENPLSSHRFVVCNRARDKVKILFRHHTGLWLWYRRLEQQRFWWPEGAQEGAVERSVREWAGWLDGLDPRCVEAHKRAGFSLMQGFILRISFEKSAMLPSMISTAHRSCDDPVLLRGVIVQLTDRLAESQCEIEAQKAALRGA
jgi:transposase